MKITFLFSLIVLAINAVSQPVFQKINFNEAVAKSKSTGKLVLLQLESENCEMCNYVVTKSFENASLSKKITETFIAIKVDSKHGDRNLVNELYELQGKSFGTLFIDGNMNLVHRYDKTTTLAKDYDKEFDVALYKNSEVIKLNIFEEIYNKNKNNNDLEEWILARKNLNINNDALLNICNYSVPIKSKIVLFFLDSKSYAHCFYTG